MTLTIGVKIPTSILYDCYKSLCFLLVFLSHIASLFSSLNVELLHTSVIIILTTSRQHTEFAENTVPHG